MHASIPFIAMLRKAVIMPKIAIACTIACAIAGQAMGARMERDRLAKAAAAAVGGSLEDVTVTKATSSQEDLARLQRSAQRDKGRRGAAIKLAPQGMGSAFIKDSGDGDTSPPGVGRVGWHLDEWWMEPPIAAVGAFKRIMGVPEDSALAVRVY